MRGLRVQGYLRVKQMMRKEKGMEEKIKKRIIGKGASGFIAKNIQICILEGENVKKQSQY